MLWYSESMASRRGFIVIVLLLLFLAPLVFFDTTRSFAQGPYPSATPDPTQCEPVNGTCYSLSFICSDWGMSLNPGKICPVGQKCCSGSTPAPTLIPTSTINLTMECGGTNVKQGELCYQASQCEVDCLANNPPAGSWSCLGVQTNPAACGICYCSDPNPTVGVCGDWEGCGWEDPPGAFCETRRCDNGCTCSALNPACCAFQIQCPCALPTGGGSVPTNTSGPPPPTAKN